MTTNTTPAVVRGRLVGATHRRSPRHLWQLEVGDGLRAAGPAGAAVLRLPTGLRAAFDYQYPERILALEVPCLDDEADLPTGSVDEDDLDLVGSLLGEQTVERLQASIDASESSDVVADVTTTEEQLIAGRMALLTSHLDDHARPVDGLWAAELVGLMHRWDQLALTVFANHLAHVAAPALRLLSPSWTGSAGREDPQAAWMLSVLLACEQAAPSADLGSLLPALRQRFAPDLTELERWLGALTNAQSGIMDLAVAGAHEAGSTPPPARVDTDEPQVLIDHTLVGWITAARAQLAGERLSVQVEPGSLLVGTSARRRITTRAAITRENRVDLLSVALSMEPDDDGTLTVELDVPPDVQGDDLIITVGRHLPIAGDRQPGAFARRQAQHHARHVLDARRRSEPTGELLASLQQSLATSGQQEAMSALLDGPVADAFLAESLPIPELVDSARCADSNDAQILAAARSLLWPQQPTQAARMEVARIATGHETDELTLEQLDTLLFDTLARGQSRLAGLLDREADRRATEIDVLEPVDAP